MADDDDQKTEEPSERRLQQARQRGQIVQSQELTLWAGMAGITLVLAHLSAGAAARLASAFLPFVERPEQMAVTLEDARAGMTGVLADFALVLAPVILPVCALSLAVALGQTGLLVTTSKLEPDPGRLSPAKGLQRMASTQALVEFGKSLIKVTAVAVVLFLLISPLLTGIEAWSTMPLISAVSEIHRLLVKMATGVTILMTFVAGADYIYQRFSFLRQMRMSKQDVKDEHKQSEGDPQIKARIRRTQRERSRRRMMAAVPTATVVVTNPTHYAVALSYEMESMPAPKVVAKGADLVAARIRELALANDVPIVENPPLARALHASVEIDAEIPADHYQAVAEVIGFVMRSRQKAARW